MLRWAPRRSCRLVSSAKKRSTWLIHDAPFGVKWTTGAPSRGNHADHARYAGGKIERKLDEKRCLFDRVIHADELMRKKVTREELIELVKLDA